jgi:predicted phage tail protein
MNKLVFHGEYADLFDLEEIGGDSISIVVEGLKRHYPEFLKQTEHCKILVDSDPLSPYSVKNKLEGNTIHFVPNVDGSSWAIFNGVMAIIGAVVSVYTIIDQAITKKHNEKARAGDTPGSLFTGIINTTVQGNSHPIVFGRFRVGSSQINVNLTGDQ